MFSLLHWVKGFHAYPLTDFPRILVKIVNEMGPLKINFPSFLLVKKSNVMKLVVMLTAWIYRE